MLCPLSLCDKRLKKGLRPSAKKINDEKMYAAVTRRERMSLRSAEEMQPGIRWSLTLNRRTLRVLISTGKGRRHFTLAASSLLYSKRCQCFLPTVDLEAL